MVPMWSAEVELLNVVKYNLQHLKYVEVSAQMNVYPYIEMNWLTDRFTNIIPKIRKGIMWTLTILSPQKHLMRLFNDDLYFCLMRIKYP